MAKLNPKICPQIQIQIEENGKSNQIKLKYNTLFPYHPDPIRQSKLVQQLIELNFSILQGCNLLFIRKAILPHVIFAVESGSSVTELKQLKKALKALAIIISIVEFKGRLIPSFFSVESMSRFEQDSEL